MEKFKFIKKEKINLLPRTPGVYAFFSDRKILYIGKANSLRERVRNHFSQPTFRDGFVLPPTSHIAYIKTESEIEALILESQLIKKYWPKYNVMWKDDKNYFYVALTKNRLPRILITHQTNENTSRYIGPFVDGAALKQTLRILRKIFPYYVAKKHPNKLCPWCHLNLCPGPNPNRKEYKKSIKNLVLVLKGKRRSVLRNLKKEMAATSKEEDFEKAAELRDQISALENIVSHSKTFQPGLYPRTSPWVQLKGRIEGYDISNIQGKFATGSMVVFADGEPDKSQYRKFKINPPSGGTAKPNDVAMIKEVLTRRFNHPEWPYPDAILIDGGKAQLNIAIKSKISARLRLRANSLAGGQNPRPTSPASELAGGRAKSKNIKIISLAKKHNELYVENRKKPIRLDSLPDSQKLVLLRLRDEAHRFAITYHKKLRAKALFK